MNIGKLAKAFAALSQNSRIQILKLITNSGDDGICPCNLIEKLGLSNANLSFHLKELENSGLVEKKKNGRFIYYHANKKIVRDLGNFLLNNINKK